MLLAAQVPTVDLYAVQSTWEKRSFGRSRHVETIVPLGRGWLIGSYLWELNNGGNYGGSDIRENCDTLLLDRPDRPDYGEGGLSGFWGGDFVARVSPGKHGYQILYLPERGEGSFVGNWEQVARRVHQLAEPR